MPLRIDYWEVPTPNEKFVKLVEAELRIANNRVIETLFPEKIGKVWRPIKAICKGCGGDLNDRNSNCKNCISRHSWRIRRGMRTTKQIPGRRPFPPTVIENTKAHPTCKGCGCPVNERSRNCTHCSRRHYMRRRAKERRERCILEREAAEARRSC